MKNLFIINPVAGKRNAYKALLPRLEAYFGGRDGEYECVYTEKRGHAAQIARNYAEKGEEIRIFACGGDGTLTEVANGIAGYPNVLLGIVPHGSGNDFLKVFGNRDCFIDIAAQISGREKRIDAIRCNERVAINICSVGMDATVAFKMAKYKKFFFISGKMGYNIAVVETLLSRLGKKLRITINDTEVYEKKLLLALAANGVYYGGSFKGSPESVVDDGLLDFVMANKISRLKILSFISKYKRGEHRQLSDIITMMKGKKMHIKSDKPLAVNLDGESVLMDEALFEIMPGAIRFNVPSSCAENL